MFIQEMARAIAVSSLYSPHHRRQHASTPALHLSSLLMGRQLNSPTHAVLLSVQKRRLKTTRRCAGATELTRRAADAATAARRDYSLAPAGALLSKAAERTMRESGADGCQPAGASPPVSPSERRQTAQPGQPQPRWQPSRGGVQEHASAHRAHSPQIDGGGDPDSEDEDGGGTGAGGLHGGANEWRDILHSQRQDDAGWADPCRSCGTAAQADERQQRDGSACAPTSGAAPGLQAPTSKSAAPGSLPAALGDLAAYAAGPSPGAADAVQPLSRTAVAPELQMSEQERADRELAERLQQEEQMAEAQRRRRSRELFLVGGDGAAAQRSGASATKRLKAGPLDMFVRRR